MKKSGISTFRDLLYASFLRINGWLMGLLGLVVAIGLAVIKPDTTVSLIWVVAAILILVIFALVSLDAANVAWSISRQGLPEVRRSLAAPPIYQGIKRLLITDPSDFFSVEALVSIYVKDDEYERFVAFGRVLTIQISGHLQIGIIGIPDGDEDIIDKLNGNDASFLKRILIKPSIPAFLLTGS